MSYNLLKTLQFFYEKKIVIDINTIKKRILFFGIPHCIYTFGTTTQKDILIHKKYTFETNGFTKFMIIDENNNHYCMNNSFWYLKWNSLEDWHKIEENIRIKIKYYGYRIPIFGIFPNIFYTRL
jgi:hypothetical protein